jgi:2-amino-4-hydroxy-6-hydroxymethyldihydropteridine diphosphokinase
VGTQTYLIAIGSNRRSRFASPISNVASALDALTPLLLSSSGPPETFHWFRGARRGEEQDEIIARSRIVSSRPLGPSKRQYANAVALIETMLAPPDLLAHFKGIERAYGRRAGRRWGDRVLDLDIIGWSGGIWASKDLSIPHPAFRTRRFVLTPLVEIAPDWRDPVTGLSARQLMFRNARRRPREMAR